MIKKYKDVDIFRSKLVHMYSFGLISLNKNTFFFWSNQVNYIFSIDNKFNLKIIKKEFSINTLISFLFSINTLV